MDEPTMFNVLRANGIDADRSEIREAVRSVLALVEGIEQGTDEHTARLCMTAMRAALRYRLLHPNIDDMSLFESDLEQTED